MSPEIASRQLDHGAWGITVADIRQAAVFRDNGVRRVLIANEVTNKSSLEWLSRIRTTDLDFHVICYVDSATGVDLTTGLFFDDTPLDVLIEVGFHGGRGGCRDVDTAIEVAERVVATRGLRLVGVSTYEGIIENDDGLVNELLRRVRDVVQSIDSLGGFSDTERIVVSAGGSIYFELVAERLRSWSQSRPVDLVIRSGGYVTHDHGYYDARSPWGKAHAGSRQLVGAIELWAEVLSVPETGLAILGFGRRHAPEDHGLPVPIMRRGRDGSSNPLEETRIERLNDQHAYLELRAETRLRVGDTVVLGISHPCTAFDKWRTIPVVDDQYKIVEVISTHF